MIGSRLCQTSIPSPPEPGASLVWLGTQGNLLATAVHAAGIQNSLAARAMLIRLLWCIDGITKAFVGGGYTGKVIGSAKGMFGYDVGVVKRNELHVASMSKR